MITSLPPACASRKKLEHSASASPAKLGATQLTPVIAPLLAAHPGDSGIHLLENARDAFAARMLLTRAAERSIDIQCYIWRGDTTGILLFEALRVAAERGVRVRLLLDDNNTFGLDPILAALDSHPNIEVRLFNPFVIRYPRWLGYVTDFLRLNRRMHNKSFTADDQATIVGGRNVGDEYFDATDGVLLADLDVIAVGPVVQEVTKDFEQYWLSESACPVNRLLAPVDAAARAKFAADALAIELAPAAAAYIAAVRNSSFARDLMEGRLELEWASTRMISDDPAKGVGMAAPEERMSQALREIIGESAFQFDLVSAYFVPTAAGVDELVALANQGTKIRIMTNALEATDVVVVHAGYAKRRNALLKAGIRLFEFRRLSARLVRRRTVGGAGSSASSGSLHAKTFSVDRARVFIGSFNFDPRSFRLNTEMGFVIDSPVLAQRIESALESGMPTMAYEVRLADTGRLCWIENHQDGPVRHDTEPGASFCLRARVQVMSLLPIEWLL